MHRKRICRTGFAGRPNARDDQLANRFDEFDPLMVLDNVFMAWEDILFYRYARAAIFIRGTFHRCSKTCAVRAASTAKG